MKKAFLVFGIAAFSSVSAQQKDLFDIQKHLQKGFAEKKQLPGILVKPSGKNSFLINYPSFAYSTKLSHIVANGDKVYLLSQDNMPCVVPDMSQFNMPNLSNSTDYFNSPSFKQNTPGTIPNAVKPYRLIASK